VPKTAEIIAVGSELLTPQRTDTNSLTITEKLNNLGVEVVSKCIIGDERDRLTDALRTAIERSDIVVVCGGLGPTEDDLTRDAAAAALGKQLVLNVDQEAILVNRFRQLNRKMAPNNLRQAYLIDGAEALPNPNGTAPGQFVSTRRGALALLPGPPREMKPMLENELLPRLRPVLPPQVIRMRSFRIAGMGESDLDALIAPVYTKYTNPTTTVLAGIGDLYVHLRAQGTSEMEVNSLLKEVGDPILALLGDRVFSEDPDDTLEAVVARRLRSLRATVSTAESCTGGLLAYRLTELAGSSDYFVGGYVTYSEEQKSSVLGVPASLIEEKTAVSEPVAAAMAEGARQRAKSTYGVSVTGWAGPSGGTDLDPVGTVYIGVATPEKTVVQRYRHGMDRYRIRSLAAQNALDMLRRTIGKE
jgi:nicotinamide-nucleotide amidase